MAPISPAAVLDHYYDLADATDPIEVDRELVARGGLWAFVQLAWEQVEPDPLVPSWHMEEICIHLEAVSREEIKLLLITIPPGCTKSTIVSVLWPVWDWIGHPKRKWMFGTFDQDLMHRDAIRCRALVRTKWFQDRWGDKVQIADTKDDQSTQSVYSTTAKGRRVSVTVGGKATGWHAQFQVIDDPTKPKDILGDPDTAAAALERAWNWYRVTMASRRSNPKKFARVIIMQRLHELDLVGRILEESKDLGELVHLNFPMEFEVERACKTKWGGDRRTEEGELLVPSRFDAAAVAELKRDLGSQAAAAQLQQRPAPAAGNIFKRDWFKTRWVDLPKQMFYCISVDCAFTDTATADFVAIHVWAYDGDHYYLLDRIHDRMGLPGTVKAIEALAKRWPKARAKLIENKANGPAVEQVLRGKLTGIIMMEPKTMGGSKIARANAVSPLCEAGDVILPDRNTRLELPRAANDNRPGHVLTYEWIDDVVEELCTFPFARNDDDVDAMTQALIYMHDRMPPRYLKAMQALKDGKLNGVLRKAA